MNNNPTSKYLNSLTIAREREWLKSLIDFRINNYFKINKTDKSIPKSPELNEDHSFYSSWIKKNNLNEIDRLLIIVSISNIFFPEIFDKFLIKNKGLDKRFTEFGGKLDSEKFRFIPTIETISFIYYGKELSSTFESQFIFDNEYVLNKISAIQFSGNENENNKMTKVAHISEEVLKLITTGETYKPDYSYDFPAKILETNLDWSDLVLNPIVMDEVENINTWLKFKDEINSDKTLQKKINKGFKCLFYGPPGTGKTLSASLIGKKNNMDVYRIDLSQIISKYVGETEKNLSRLFDLAENKNWILFFDEAESLFSKRTSVGDSKDKFANQQTAFLLQRIEDYNGLVILATNLKPNIDRAFTRRIQSTINFPIPTINERKILWKNFLNDISDIKIETINQISKDYEISGGTIKNVIQYSWLYSKRNDSAINKKYIIQGIKRELMKDGKTIN